MLLGQLLDLLLLEWGMLMLMLQMLLLVKMLLTW